MVNQLDRYAFIIFTVLALPYLFANCATKSPSLDHLNPRPSVELKNGGNTRPCFAPSGESTIVVSPFAKNHSSRCNHPFSATPVGRNHDGAISRPPASPSDAVTVRSPPRIVARARAVAPPSAIVPNANHAGHPRRRRPRESLTDPSAITPSSSSSPPSSSASSPRSKTVASVETTRASSPRSTSASRVDAGASAPNSAPNADETGEDDDDASPRRAFRARSAARSPLMSNARRRLGSTFPFGVERRGRRVLDVMFIGHSGSNGGYFGVSDEFRDRDTVIGCWLSRIEVIYKTYKYNALKDKCTYPSVRKSIDCREIHRVARTNARACARVRTSRERTASSCVRRRLARSKSALDARESVENRRRAVIAHRARACSSRWDDASSLARGRDLFARAPWTPEARRWARRFARTRRAGRRRR